MKSPNSLMPPLATILVVLFAAMPRARGGEVDRDSLACFENNIRPLLVDHCIKCHGPKKSESGLRLDSIATALKGGEGGPAVIPGKPENNSHHSAVRHQDDLEMPLDGKLDETLIAVITDFGRTPKINNNGGRDRYPNVHSQILAGGGIRGGQVYGSSDICGGQPLPLV